MLYSMQDQSVIKLCLGHLYMGAHLSYFLLLQICVKKYYKQGDGLAECTTLQLRSKNVIGSKICLDRRAALCQSTVSM